MDDTVMDDAALEAALRRLGTRLAYPETPDFSEWVALEVAAIGPPPPVPGGLLLLRLRRTVLAVAAAVVLVTAGLLTLSPRARAIADDLIHLRGIRVEQVRRLPPAGTELHLGRAVSLAEAGRLAGWRIAQPRTLGPPDTVYVTAPAGDPRRTVVSLVYRARPGLPAAPETGAALILSEFRGRGADPLMIKKLVGGGTAIDFVTVNTREAYWIAGPHVVVFVDPGGTSLTDLPRLSASTVLWSDGDITYRLESTLGETGALRVANSVR
jgi:hypothetical protein